MKLSNMPSLKPSARPVKTRFEHAYVDSFNDDASSEPSQIELSSSSPIYMKTTSCSDAKKGSSQASFHDSESSFSSSNPIEKESYPWKPNIVSFGHIKAVGNSRRVLRLKSSWSLKKKSSRTAPFPNFADYVMPHQGGNESDGASNSSSSYGFMSRTPSFLSEDYVMKGGTEKRKTLKKSRSTRLGSSRTLRPTNRLAKSRFDQPVSSLSSVAETPPIQVADVLPNYLKATSSSKGKKMHFQASLHDSESSFGFIDVSRRNSHSSTSNSCSSSLKSMQTLRTSSLRTSRILVNNTSFKSKRPSVKNCSQNSQELSVNRATCSSTLKNSKFPHHVELHPGERELERISDMKVCQYNHCSLHGHHHSATPPLKHLLSKRRRLLSIRKSMKQRSQSSLKAKYADNIMKEIETSQMVVNGDSELQDKTNASTEFFPVGEEGGYDLPLQIYTKPTMEFFGRSSEGKEEANLAEVLSVETSYPEKGVQENLNQERDFVMAEQDIPEQFSKHKETKVGSCCIKGSLSLLSLKLDNVVTTSCDEVPSPNLGFCELEKVDLTGISGEPPNIAKRSTSDDTREATEDNTLISSASICHSLEELSLARNEKNRDLATDPETITQFAVGVYETTSTACEEYKSQLNKKKHISMWHLIHQHMVSGLAAGAGTQLLEGTDEEKLLDDTNTLPAPQSSGGSPGCSDSYQNMGVENHNTDNQETELHKMYAIKMVRDAIEKILLPEVQDQSSDDQPISSDLTSKQKLLEKNHGEGSKLSISTVDNISDSAGEVAASEERKKAEKKTPKSWSNLKKLILLKRFIKELEKVRKFNPREPQHLPLEHDQEAEKVCLRHQMIDKKKSSEEWMLDYAVQQAVSELAPTQRRKVALLIKAFETVFPPSDEQQIQVIFPKFKSIRHESYSSESVCDATYRDTIVEENVISNLDNTEKRSSVLINGEAEQEVHENRISNFNLELLKDDSASSGQTMEVDGLSGVSGQSLYITKSQSADGNGKSKVTDNIASSDSDNGSFKKLTVVGKVKYGDSDPWEKLATMYNQESSLTAEHSHFPKSCSPANPLKPDYIVSTGSEEVRNMNSEFCKENDPESNIEELEIDNLIVATDRPPSIRKRPTSDDLVETAVNSSVIPSACGCGPLEELTAAREQKDGDSEVDTASTEGSGPVRNFEPDNSGHEAYETEFGKEKHVSMWNLIHQHMVAGLAVEGNTKQLDKENEEHVGDANRLAAIGSSGSCPGFCAPFQKIGMEQNQEAELRQIYAIKLVREAIEKILLPEVQDQSSDNQSIASENMSDQELIEKKTGEVGEPSISNSTDSAKDSSLECNSNKVSNDKSPSQEGTRHATANISESEDEKTALEVQKKYDKQTPKGWSNLKKLILLKRFIKELEKVRKFNPQKPRHLPLNPGPEAEEVCLRHQTMDERKSAEEWMLDYALRKVVSELAPKQKKKVALLVQAFETVVPPSEEPQIQVKFPKFKGTNRECCCSESEHDKIVSKTTEADIKVHDIVTSNLENRDNNSTITNKIHDVAGDEEAHKEVHKGIVSSFSLRLLKDGSELTGENMKIDGLSGVRVEPSYITESAAPDGSRESTETYNIASSASDFDPLEQLTATKEKKNGDSANTDKVAYKTLLDKQKYLRMWHLLCQHVVSGIATKVEAQILDGDDEDEQVGGAKTLPQIRIGSCHYSRADHDRGKKDCDSNSQGIEFSQRDAVKLVQEAIEEILLQENQNDSSSVNAQSIASGNVGEPSILTSMDSPKDSFREYETSKVEGHNIIHEEGKGSEYLSIPSLDEQRVVSMLGNKVDQQKPKNWSKLKKLILLERSIKALEKARKSNLQTPRNLPLEPGMEEEKFDLRHQLNDERKKAEEWMLDYALQHVVTKLTPARKKRVTMLVQAFEAVVPLPEI